MVTFRDTVKGTGKIKTGYRKIRFCIGQAASGCGSQTSWACLPWRPSTNSSLDRPTATRLKKERAAEVACLLAPYYWTAGMFSVHVVTYTSSGIDLRLESASAKMVSRERA